MKEKITLFLCLLADTESRDSRNGNEEKKTRSQAGPKRGTCYYPIAKEREKKCCFRNWRVWKKARFGNRHRHPAPINYDQLAIFMLLGDYCAATKKKLLRQLITQIQRIHVFSFVLSRCEGFSQQ